ncbi:hypothetical protein [Pseudomonas phage D6]|nr:hypothetical protein [Pseudomonas phage D6]
MKRYNETKTDNAWSGLVDVWMTETPTGEYVKHKEVADLQSRARQLGYDDLDDALNALAVYKEQECFGHTGD